MLVVSISISLSFFISIKIVIIKTIGKHTPASKPTLKLSPEFCEIIPINLGPIDPPRSPANASRANNAVPPNGIVFEDKLIEPGHIIPIENPQNAQPISPNRGEFDSPANK